MEALDSDGEGVPSPVVVGESAHSAPLGSVSVPTAGRWRPGSLWARRGLRARAVTAMAVTSLLLALSLALLAYSLVRRALIDDHESGSLRQAYTNARVVRNALRNADPEIADLLSSLQVGNDGGAVLVTTTQSFTSSVDVDVAEIPPALAAGVRDGRAGRQQIRGEDGPMLIVGVPIESVDAEYYEITSLAEVESTLQVLASSLAIGAGASVVVGAAIGATVSGAVLRPLGRIADVARRIVDGKIDSRLDAESDRDLAPLADAFNEMLDELRGRIDRESRFASDVSHELRGPLTVLAAAVDVVDRRRAELPPEASRAVAALDAQVIAFNKLVLDLLEISRFEAGSVRLNTRMVDLEELVGALLVERPGPGPRVTRTGSRPIKVRLDPGRLHQVLTNILDNAERYAGGATAMVVSRTAEDRVRIMVDDNGPGVPEQDRVRIFERFVRGAADAGSPTPGGSGLGLALCANHVQLHGGKIWVEDSPMGGARFVVELPGTP